jgi:uncharacterized membrane protein (UPF0127 family)
MQNSKGKIAAVFVAFVAFLWLLTPEEEEKSPYLKQNIVEPAPEVEIDPVQQMIDAGDIPALNSLKSDTAKQRDARLLNAAQMGEPAPMSFPVEQIKIKTARGLLPLMAGIATTPQQQEAGMMYYRRWPADKMHGLLFIFKKPAVLTMWMKNTYIPLDIIFMDGEGKILNIHERARPLNEETIASDGLAEYVLEIPAGAARHWQIVEGDRLIYTPQAIP